MDDVIRCLIIGSFLAQANNDNVWKVFPCLLPGDVFHCKHILQVDFLVVEAPLGNKPVRIG